MNETKSSLHPLFADIVKSFSNPKKMKTTKSIHEWVDELGKLRFTTLIFEQKEAEQIINFILSFRKDIAIKVQGTDDNRVTITKI